jgi:peptidoglycan/LPS O-acetylase OafA/YrhL
MSATPATDGRPPAGGDVRAGGPLRWLDLVRGFAIFWIFFNHVAERLFGFPWIGNPAPGWPPLAERIAQLRPLAGHGAWDLPLTLLRAFGWSGDQGVSLFLIASGFGLTWGLLRRHGRDPLPPGEFYARRLLRIYPQWWGAHLLFALSALAIGWGFSATTPAFWASLAGIRCTPRLMYAFSPAWWYVGLILQLYAVYPLLWEGLRRRGPGWLLGVACVAGFAARLVGLLTLHGWLDAWQRGAIFITRLPEFALGVALAAWMSRSPGAASAALRRPRTLLLAVAAYALGTALSLTLAGMALAPFLLGASVLLLLHALFTGGRAWSGRAAEPLAWLGRHSYAIYLVHEPLVRRLVPAGFAHGGRRALIGVVAALAATMVVGALLEWAVGRVEAAAARVRARVLVLRLAAGAAVVLALLVGAELVSRRVAPQELDGWGERASLVPDPVVGWKLRPASETRLRWLSYDYRVKANALGFPGPLYPAVKAPGTFRILVTGDAFSSAEGVDTDSSWARRLERGLAGRPGAPSRRVEVMDFAITGYGPNQYAAVVRRFAPLYRPDLVLVEFYVNEYQDVMQSDSSFRASIGFARPSPDRLGSILRLQNLAALLRTGVRDPLLARLRRRPDPQGWFLGGFATLERGKPGQDPARRAVTARLEEIREAARRIQARVLIVLVPAPVQVCGPRDLAYYPGGTDLSDTTRFDLDLPQRTTRAIADSLGLACLDLRPALRAASRPYQPHNIHWTAAGHRAVAAWLADTLAAGGWLATR